MQNKVQLYIENQKLDLFSDESIEINSKIQDLRDIGKIFTDFTQAFNVPASPANNKIFSHFYNYNITTGAYDHRTKKVGIIEINHLRFREGKVHLNGVVMKNQKPHTYNIVFYGKTVSIKDLVGDDELSDLDYLSNYDHEYNNTNVKAGLESGLDFTVNSVSQTDAIIYPLITSKKRLFYDSVGFNSTSGNFSGNLYFDTTDTSGTNGGRGLEFTDLKPAIKAIHIIEAIENKYSGIEFTRDFFGNSAAFSNLYLWLSSKKGELNENEDDESYTFVKKLTGYTSSDPNPFVTISGSDITINTITCSYDFVLSFTVSDTTEPYRIIVRNTATGQETITDGVGNKTGLNLYFVARNQNTGITQNLEIELSSKTGITFSSISLDIESIAAGFFGSNSVNINKTYTISAPQQTTFLFDTKIQMPKLKVIDFLTGIFKMFNLTAYYIEDPSDTDYEKIYVDTLDNFYADAVNNQLTQTITLDKYVDISEHNVDVTLPFTDIEFEYQETNTVLMEHHEERFREVFGNAEFNVRNSTRDTATNTIKIDRGTKYQIKLPFSHLKYERLLNLGTFGTPTDIQWGYSAGGEFRSDTTSTPPTGDFDSRLIKPLLFYGIQQTTSNSIAFLDGGSASEVTTYFRPSNSNEEGTSTTPAAFTLNFDNEVDEWSRSETPNAFNSLYANFYQSYVEGVFNVARRMHKITAFLPSSIIANYKLNHQIKIHDRMFRINSITINLVTGKSTIELYNIFQSDIV